MKKFIWYLACVLVLSILQVQAYTACNELRGRLLQEWLSDNRIKIRVNETGESWALTVMCPPEETNEWNLSLRLQYKLLTTAVSVKPRIISDSLSKLKGWVVFDVVFSFDVMCSKEFLETSKILMYMEPKIPRDPWQPPHILYSISLKDLSELATGAKKP